MSMFESLFNFCCKFKFFSIFKYKKKGSDYYPSIGEYPSGSCCERVSEEQLFMLLSADKSAKSSVLLLHPEEFNIEKHIKLFPSLEYGFVSKLNFATYKVEYILSLLTSIPANNKNIITENGYIPINKRTLNSSIKDATSYLNYLIKTGVIISDGIYIIGEKSIGYKWADKYNNSTFVCKQTEKKFTIPNRSNETPYDISYRYLAKWYHNNKLKIDYKNATIFAENIRNEKMSDSTMESWDWNSSTEKRKNPQTQYYAAMQNINKIKSNLFDPMIDENVHRLHSTLTNIQKQYRNFITYDSHELVSIDVKNCQPYLMCLLFNPKFWAVDSDLPISFIKVYPNIKDLFSNELLVDIRKFANKVNSDEFSKYIKLVSNGEIYEKLIAESAIQLGKNIERKYAKEIMFHLLFACNRSKIEDNEILSGLKKIFKSLFPSVVEFITIVKRGTKKKNKSDKPHARLSCLLQALESYIVLNICCKKIWQEKKYTIPIFTIHDSIVTTTENKDYVYKVMEETFKEHIGLTPKLSVENWTIDNIDEKYLHKNK